ncbi:MAG TPA: DUF423 domain-containing protein [Cyclobacteriaceae bacterium]|nr:DUF423 domain-containing protein [Cyclobacteriaceae bacterium]
MEQSNSIMQLRTTLIFAAISGMIAVMLGAFGAHALKEHLISTGRLDTYNLAVEYQFYHSLALLATGLVAQSGKTRQLSIAAVSFAAGILIFSGSLYILAIFNVPIAGAITPIGGVGLIAGWLFLILHFYKRKRSS